MKKLPWYHEGLAFRCTQCGDCCTGEPGYVWVNQEEIDAMAKELGMKPEQFEHEYVEREGRRRTLRERENGDCVILDEKTRKCRAYQSRPRQCRTWPFWQSNLRSPADWERTCQECPGAGTGDLVPLEKIQEQMKQIRV
ncbi:Flagellin N-methylase [Planctomycetales bacterium 10988]|nr:Flagellin N-methylase [Planctomycetales bacterium 10988]